ncbi:MAG: hypothetical protein A2Y45_01495 [Tenericutes bacterium GWC2_34_14]|nr:MAG: hypothetical protein A2Z84_04720 [Tenericutes bacterium GWA2_35_7]OHE28213.1 MAG: hypothetical protein A2Y45_01495 [Tenericutes bacterium GWC2_34_14]OHE33161.1 MAG: hypothetical protein A2012_00585 [Tenericutes bacterium GWE2_34_108]OHE36281.1 MAG: hypothetical protein A2Y46_07575 [Tenericutes bacterium GWF1_35_14]OHE38677.1 MAG: hypothetical protein A2Y44_04655 [Tenericutes bacterium GWF2_35_184]OHE44824.1 MAG: hypothetical protein A2221_01240 [Tenericutes bacterium RIFOXYA2_FULL_36_3
MIIIWYKYIYEFLFQTEPLFNDFFLDWIFPAAIVFLLYDFAFGVVGGLYRAGIIRGRDLGSIIHWGIRYGMMWGTIQILIFIRDNWLYIVLAAVGAIIVFVLIGLFIRSLLMNKFI